MVESARARYNQDVAEKLAERIEGCVGTMRTINLAGGSIYDLIKLATSLISRCPNIRDSITEALENRSEI